MGVSSKLLSWKPPSSAVPVASFQPPAGCHGDRQFYPVAIVAHAMFLILRPKGRIAGGSYLRKHHSE